MIDRKASLRPLAVGDIFHAKSPNGASLICLTTSIDDTTIHARTVTTQIDLQFDRETGVAQWGYDMVPCTIDSVAPLPPEVHAVLIGVDNKFRMERDPMRLKLSDAEKRALVFVSSHYPMNPL